MGEGRKGYTAQRMGELQRNYKAVIFFSHLPNPPPTLDLAPLFLNFRPSLLNRCLSVSLSFLGPLCIFLGPYLPPVLSLLFSLLLCISVLSSLWVFALFLLYLSFNSCLWISAVWVSHKLPLSDLGVPSHLFLHPPLSRSVFP